METVDEEIRDTAFKWLDKAKADNQPSIASLISRGGWIEIKNQLNAPSLTNLAPGSRLSALAIRKMEL